MSPTSVVNTGSCRTLVLVAPSSVPCSADQSSTGPDTPMDVTGAMTLCFSPPAAALNCLSVCQAWIQPRVRMPSGDDGGRGQGQVAQDVAALLGSSASVKTPPAACDGARFLDASWISRILCTVVYLKGLRDRHDRAAPRPMGVASLRCD